MSNTRLNTKESIILGDKVVDFLLVRSKKRKYSLSMQVKQDGFLQVNVPFNTDIMDVSAFILSKTSWVLGKLIEKNQRAKTQSNSFNDGDMHWYLGKPYRIKLIITAFSRIDISDGVLLVYMRRNQSVKNLMDKWYKQQALFYLIQRTHYYAELHGFLEVKDIKVRNMKARWGSCSSARVITYNTHLIKTPPECIDYVVIHELCHFIHQNHQKGFHNLQLKLNPIWKQQKKKLAKFSRNYL